MCGWGLIWKMAAFLQRLCFSGTNRLWRLVYICCLPLMSKNCNCAHMHFSPFYTLEVAHMRKNTMHAGSPSFSIFFSGESRGQLRLASMASSLQSQPQYQLFSVGAIQNLEQRVWECAWVYTCVPVHWYFLGDLEFHWGVSASYKGHQHTFARDYRVSVQYMTVILGSCFYGNLLPAQKVLNMA